MNKIFVRHENKCLHPNFANGIFFIRVYEQRFNWLDCITYPNIEASFPDDWLHAPNY